MSLVGSKRVVLLGGGQAFTPKSLPGLQLWLDAGRNVYSDAGTTPANDADTVQQWNDLSGKGNNAAQATSGKRPEYKVSIFNGRPVLRFLIANATGLQVGANGDFASQAFTVSAVFDKNVVAVNQAILSKGDGSSAAGSTWELMAENGTSQTAFNTFTTTTANNAGALYAVTGSLEIVTGTNDSAFTRNIYKNGAFQGTATDSGAINAGAVPLGIGMAGDGTPLFFTGDIAEIVYYNRVLSGAELSRLHRYLGLKYGVTIT